MDCLLHISRIVVKPSAQNLHIGQLATLVVSQWAKNSRLYLQLFLCTDAAYHVETTLCAYNLSCLAGHGVRQGAERAQDDCNFGYFSTRLALLWHEAIAIPLIQVIFCPTCLTSFDGPHLFLGNNEQRAKKQRPGAGGTIFCQNI